MGNEKIFKICRVCGYEFQNFEPWGRDGRTPSFSHCPCCFTEFGFDDVKLEMIKSKRKMWIDGGSLWYEPEKRSENWNSVEQMKNIPDEYK